MSTLGSLFGGGSSESDSNDALKYVAPKEPKARQAAPATKAAAASGTPAKAAPASKFIATASVRLFKLNTSTNAYDAVAGGSPLGCIIVGAATNYQILIYNAQKAPQAIAPITPTFAYNIRDLYMSFTDAQGSNWSVLFDTSESLTSFARTIAATIAHAVHHTNASLSAPIKGILPPTDADGSSPLAVGSTAGVVYQGWLLNNDVNDSPADLLTNAPYYTATSQDIAKVKVGPQSSEEPFAGVGAVLVNHTKGDRMMLILPSSATRNTGLLLLEMEIVKVKSKEKKKEKEITPITPVSAPPEQMEPQSPKRSGSLKDRMSYLSNQGGGGGGAAALASAMGGHHSVQLHHHEHSHTSQSHQEQHSTYQPPQQAVYHPPQQSQNQTPQQPQYQAQQQVQSNPPQQQQYNASPQQYPTQQSHHQAYQPQQYSTPPQQQNHYNSYQQSEAQRYALTVVEGQGPRSYYAEPPPPQPVSTSIDPAASSTIQQTLLALQSSMMAAHNKLDALASQSGSMVNYANKSAVRMKSDEIVSAIQALVESCEKAESNSMSGRDRETIAKLEDKVDTLMMKNEKLSQEKSDLWEKHATHLQSAAENATKLDSIRRDRAKDASIIEGLRLQIQQAAQNSEDKCKVAALESECRLLRVEKDTLENQITQQLATIRSMENDMRQLRQALATAEKDHANEKLSLEAEITALKAQLSSSANATVDLQCDEVQAYVKVQCDAVHHQMQAQVDALKADVASSASQASAAINDVEKFKADARKAEEQIEQLRQELDAARAAKPAEDDHSEVIQNAMKEALQRIFEGMHEMFADEEGEEPASYSGSDVLKRVKRVLKNAAVN